MSSTSSISGIYVGISRSLATYGYVDGIHEVVLLSLSLRQITFSKKKKKFSDRLEQGISFTLYIKLSLKNYVKTMDKNDAAFQNLCTLFQVLSSAQLKLSIFVEPRCQTRAE